MKRWKARFCGWALPLMMTGCLVKGEVHELRFRNNVVNSTPEVLGYTLGHMMPGSNTFDWLRYSEVNGFRVWSTPKVIEGEDDLDPWGDGVDSWESFLERRTALRTDPLNEAYINWPVFEAGYDRKTVSASRLRIRDVMEYGKSEGLTPLVMIHRGVGSYPFADGLSTDWASRWECWQHFYAQAFWLGRHFDVERFQVYNEPDHSSSARLPQEEYIERLKISSDAVQCAIEDVNRLYGKSLSPRITAPVTTSGVTRFFARPERKKPDRRDAERGWGELVMEERLKPYFPDAPEGYANFNVYAYQQYGRNGPGFADQYREIRRLVTQANGGDTLPVYITEFNVLANYQFRRTEDTMHTPSRAMRLGSILLNLILEQPDELYVFKFGQTIHTESDYLAKNGNFWQDNDNSIHATTGSTRGAEVYRLVMRTFQRGRSQLDRPAWIGDEPEKTWAGAALDEQSGTYHAFIVTEQSKKAVSLRLDLSELELARPTVAVLEEVSQARHGSVRAIVQIPASGKVDLELSPESAWHLEIPKNPPRFALVEATADAVVKGGGQAAENFGDVRELVVSGDRFQASKRSAAYIQFDTDAPTMASARKVLLRLNLRSSKKREVNHAHLYGMPGTDWSESGLTGRNAPNLDIDGPSIRDLGDNLVRGQGDGLQILGTATGTSGYEDQFYDITSFALANPDGFSVLLTQEYRFTGDLEQGGHLLVHSREAGQAGPQLLIFY